MIQFIKIISLYLIFKLHGKSYNFDYCNTFSSAHLIFEGRSDVGVLFSDWLFYSRNSIANDWIVSFGSRVGRGEKGRKKS